MPRLPVMAKHEFPALMDDVRKSRRSGSIDSTTRTTPWYFHVTSGGISPQSYGNACILAVAQAIHVHALAS
jgi:hypothetical protein